MNNTSSLSEKAVYLRHLLEENDICEMGHLISLYGLLDLPWQISAEPIDLHTLPARTYKLGDACLMLANPEAARVVIWSYW
jgi:hypothetical protein